MEATTHTRGFNLGLIPDLHPLAPHPRRQRLKTALPIALPVVLTLAPSALPGAFSQLKCVIGAVSQAAIISKSSCYHFISLISVMVWTASARYIFIFISHCYIWYIISFCTVFPFYHFSRFFHYPTIISHVPDWTVRPPSTVTRRTCHGRLWSALVGYTIGLHFGCKKTGKISIVFEAFIDKISLFSNQSEAIVTNNIGFDYAR